MEHDPHATGSRAAIPERMTIEFIRDATGLSLAEIQARLAAHGIPCDNHIVNRSDIPARLSMCNVLAILRSTDA